MTDGQIFEKLLGLIREYANDDSIINKDTLLENDLGITGDDAYDLIIKISKVFNLNISAFNFSNYFAPEPHIFPIVLPPRKKELSVGDILDAIQIGQLV